MSSKRKDLGSMTSAVTNAGVSMDTTPFMAHDSALARLYAPAGAFSGTAKIQGSNDADSVADGSATWTDLLTFTTTTGGYVEAEVALYRRMRATCTAFTSGTAVGALSA